MGVIMPPSSWNYPERKTKLQVYTNKLAPLIHVEETKLQRYVKNVVSFLDADWDPNDIFYASRWKTDSYTVHHAHMEHSAFLGIGSSKIYKAGDQKYYSHTEKHYTPLGEWFNSMPGIVGIVKLPYYIVAWPTYFILFWVSGICKLLFTSQSSRGW